MHVILKHNVECTPPRIDESIDQTMEQQFQIYCCYSSLKGKGVVFVFLWDC